MKLTEEEQAALKASLHEIIDQLDITHCNIEACGRRTKRIPQPGDKITYRPGMKLEDVTQVEIEDTGVRILWIVGNTVPDPEVGIYPVGSVSADDFPYEFADDEADAADRLQGGHSHPLQRPANPVIVEGTVRPDSECDQDAERSEAATTQRPTGSS